MKTTKKEKEPPKYPEIGARLAQFITESDEPNARQFALKAGLSPQLISHNAAGYSIPGGETLMALSKTYKDFDSDWLLTGKRKAGPEQAKEPRLDKAGAKPTTMQVVDESGELKEVKSERDFLRDQLRNALSIIRGMRSAGPSPSTGTHDESFKSGNLTPAASDEPQAQFMYVQMVGTEAPKPRQVDGLIRYDNLQDELEQSDSEEVTHLRVAS